MTKRQHTIIAALLCCFCLPAAAQDIGYGTIEGQTVVHSCDLRELLHASKSSSTSSKMRQRIETDETVVNYRDRITNMPAFLHDFCDQYVKAAQTVLDGGTSWLSDYMITDGTVEIQGGTYYYLLNEVTDSTDFTFPIDSDAGTIKQAALDAAQVYINMEIDSLNSFIPYAFLSVNFDHPEAFWVSNFFKYGYSYGYRYRYRTSEGKGTVIFTIKSMFILHDNSSKYDIRNNGFTKYDFRSPANISKEVKTYHSSIQTILEQCQSKSLYKRLLKVHNWLTTHNCYNRYHSKNNWGVNELGGMPWSPLSALIGNANSREAPVCEGYARAMKVLCDKMGIPCILMSGDAATSPYSEPQPHMWNYIQMEDGNWYAVDATWDDPITETTKAVSGQESLEWFLLGSEVGLDDGWSFFDSHPEQWAYIYSNNGSIGWELLEGPKLSPTSYVLPDPCDPNGDGVTDMEEITMMVDKIANDDDDIKFDVDGNEVLTIGDLVRMINCYISK